MPNKKKGEESTTSFNMNEPIKLVMLGVAAFTIAQFMLMVLIIEIFLLLRV
tara:strand:+ start:1036 stop:1188 length:153 start_codon:yes stop_codon:yes gene_type:complete